mmetsp:Transcript_26843/g.86247  ORF Transcript_26843/g.86247 Transcript_26843/m.86247 type:complete len:257 (+) Transcript_26843:593-1363(+)
MATLVMRSSHASFASPSSAVGRTSSSSEASVSKTGCAIHREPSAAGGWIPPPPRRQPRVQVRPRLLARSSAAVLELGDHRRRARDVLAEGFAPGGVVLGAGVEKERQVGRLRQRRPLDQPAVEAAGALAVRVERYLASEAVVADANCVPEHEVAPKVGVEVLAPGRQQRVGPHALLKPLEEELVPIHRQVIGQRRDPHQQHTSSELRSGPVRHHMANLWNSSGPQQPDSTSTTPMGQQMKRNAIHDRTASSEQLRR